MARHLALSTRALLSLVVFAAAAPALFAAPAPASTPPPPAPATPPAPAPPATNALGVAIPPVPDDYFQRYGRIIAPGTEPQHPLKLAMPLPDVGMVKVPTPDELKMRDKLEELAALSDADIRANLEKWPAYGKMTLSDEGVMLMRIQQFKDQRAKTAQAAARRLGLLTLTPDQEARFEKEYWDKRVQVDRDLARQFEPILLAREQKMQEELFREFSSPIPPPGKPAPPPPAIAQDPTKPAPPPMH